MIAANNGNECADTIQQAILIPENPEQITNKLFIPNSFTPNGDGLNEVFRIGYSRVDIPFSIEIYNRWGELIYSANRADFGWDGTYRGEPCMQGVYPYIIRGEISMRGEIKLIR